MKMNCIYVNSLKLNPGELTLDFYIYSDYASVKILQTLTKQQKATTIAKKYFRDTRKCLFIQSIPPHHRHTHIVLCSHVQTYSANSTECFSSGKVSIQTGNEITIIKLTAHWRKIHARIGSIVAHIFSRKERTIRK